MSHYIPQARLQTYQRFFNTHDIEAIHRIYHWFRYISADLFLLVGDFEVIFRSHLHTLLSNHYVCETNDYWFINETLLEEIFQIFPNLTNRQRHNFSAFNSSINIHFQGFLSPFKLTETNQQKILRCVFDFVKRNSTNIPNPEDVISRLTFGFWVEIFQAFNNRSHRAHRQHLMQQLFPNHVGLYDDNFYKANLDTLYRIRNLRNRISHQEHILKVPESNFPHRDFLPRNPRQSLSSIKKLIFSISEFIGMMNTNHQTELSNMSYFTELMQLLDISLLENLNQLDIKLVVTH